MDYSLGGPPSTSLLITAGQQTWMPTPAFARGRLFVVGMTICLEPAKVIASRLYHTVFRNVVSLVAAVGLSVLSSAANSADRRSIAAS